MQTNVQFAIKCVYTKIWMSISTNKIINLVCTVNRWSGNLGEPRCVCVIRWCILVESFRSIAYSVEIDKKNQKNMFVVWIINTNRDIYKNLHCIDRITALLNTCIIQCLLVYFFTTAAAAMTTMLMMWWSGQPLKSSLLSKVIGLAINSNTYVHKCAMYVITEKVQSFQSNGIELMCTEHTINIAYVWLHLLSIKRQLATHCSYIGTWKSVNIWNAKWTLYANLYRIDRTHSMCPPQAFANMNAYSNGFSNFLLLQLLKSDQDFYLNGIQTKKTLFAILH